MRKGGDGTSAILGSRNATCCHPRTPAGSQEVTESSQDKSLELCPSTKSTLGYKQPGTGVGKDFITSLNAASLSITALRFVLIQSSLFPRGLLNAN